MLLTPPVSRITPAEHPRLQELLSLSKIEADRRADFYTHHWGFPNTYCLGKHLAEQLVYRTHQATGLPLAILRPSLVTGVAGLPWPGERVWVWGCNDTGYKRVTPRVIPWVTPTGYTTGYTPQFPPQHRDMPIDVPGCQPPRSGFKRRARPLMHHDTHATLAAAILLPMMVTADDGN